MVTQGQASTLLNFTFTTFQSEFDAVLEALCQRTLNIATGPPYHKILYSWRVSRGDFRGAASILYERLHRLLTTSSSVYDPEDESLIQNYLLLINILASVDPDQAWILAETPIVTDGNPFTSGSTQLAKGKPLSTPKRRVITLDDIRKEYQAELDRVAEVENGRFAFGGGTEPMDVL